MATGNNRLITEASDTQKITTAKNKNKATGVASMFQASFYNEENNGHKKQFFVKINSRHAQISCTTSVTGQDYFRINIINYTLLVANAIPARSKKKKERKLK